MNKISFLTSIIAVFIAVSCQHTEDNPVQHRVATGGVQYGGVFHSNEVENFRSLFPHDAGDVSSYNIGSQIYEGLVRFDPKSLDIIPGIAKSWDISEDGLVYTFKIREGVYFHDNACFEDGIGRELEVEDVIFSLTMLCTPSPMNDYYPMVVDRIVGARAHFNALEQNQEVQEPIAGLVRVDNSTLQISLVKPFKGFIKILATASCWVFPEEAFDMYGEDMRDNCVGTGPFQVIKIVDNEVVILGKNKDYWRRDEFGNQLPYLDALKFTFVKEKKSEILEFKKGNLDMVYRIPSDQIAEFKINASEDRGDFMLDDYRVQIAPSLSIQYYSFQHMSDVFKDINVRKAFNCAIDKKRIVEYGLHGMGTPAIHGLVPPSIRDYPIEKIIGYEYSPKKAQEYLADAGFQNGEGFPRLTLQINSGGSENLGVAEIVQKMLSDNLGVYIDLSVTGRVQHYDRVASGKSNFWKDAWIADYSDPENFLYLFYGALVPEDSTARSYTNSTRYKSAIFDEFYENANIEQDDDKRMNLLCKADQIIIDDAAVIPLYYEKTIRLVKPYVKNYPLNPMEFSDFSTVYFNFQEKNEGLTAIQ